VNLTDYSLDDLHICALREVDGDEQAQRVLNELYRAMQHEYIAALKMLRAEREGQKAV
jgi:hypothetical protein